MQVIIQTGLRPYKWNLGAINYYPGSTSQEWMQGARDSEAAIKIVPEGDD